MAHVLVQVVTPFIEYSVGSGGQTVFTIPSSWAFFNVDTDIRVFKDGVELTYDATPADATEFSVAGTSGTDSGFNGGTVTLGASVASCTVAIQRDVPVKRTEDFPYPSSTFNIQALNTALDKIAAWAQQFKLIFNRSIRLADGDAAATLTLPDATNRASKLVGFDSSGNLEMLTPNSDTYISASPFSLTALAATTAAAWRTVLGLGTAATSAATAFEPAQTDASQVEAEAGTEAALRSFSPLRIAQAIAAQASGIAAADQSEMEAASATDVAVTPGRQHFHPGHPKAWISFNGTGTIAINADYGVASITDNGTGDYTVTFDTAFSSANYVCVANADRTVGSTNATEGMQVESQATGAFRMIWVNTVPGAVDQVLVMAAFFGDQ